MPPGHIDQQVADALRHLIATGVHPVGALLPPVDALARDLSTDTTAVEQALRILDEQQLTGGRPGEPRVVLRREPPPARTPAERVASSIRTWIGRGEADPGSRLPTQKALAAAYAVSLADVRKALAVLEASGEIVRRAGRWYVIGTRTSRPTR